VQLIFLSIAHNELAEAKLFYNRQQRGLGESFQCEAEAAARQIQARPLAWQTEVEPVRRFLLDRFPYKMFYIIRADRIIVIAIAHQHRHPDYWVDRISGGS
jgi:plasmid stabilization system protein ParE